MDKLDEILEAVRRGGYYDALPDERNSLDWLDTDVARQRIIAWVESIIGLPDKDYTWPNGEVSTMSHYKDARNALRAEQRKRLEGKQ